MSPASIANSDGKKGTKGKLYGKKMIPTVGRVEGWKKRGSDRKSYKRQEESQDKTELGRDEEWELEYDQEFNKKYYL